MNLISPFESRRGRMAAHLLFACLIFSAASVAAKSPGIRLDVGALAVVYVALEYPLLRGAVAALMLAYLADLFSGESRGLTMTSLAVVFVVVRLLVVRITGARWLMITAVSLLAVVIDLMIKLVLEALVGPGLLRVSSVVPALGVLISSAVLLGYPCFCLFRLIDDRFRPEANIVYGSLVPRRWM